MGFLNLLGSLGTNVNPTGAITSTNTSGIKQLQYPADLFSPGNEAYIIFSIRDAVAKNAPIKSMIALYMPPSLEVNYGSDWSGYKINTLYYTDIARYVRQQSADATNSVANFEKILAGVATRAAALGIDTATLNKTSFDTDRDLAKRRTVNPHDALLYDGQKMRSFNFKFQMMARNPQESQAIYDIIKEFKLAASPSLREEELRYWNYPDDIDVDLRTPAKDTMFKFATSVIKDIKVEYGENGIQSFFNDTGHPVDVILSITIEEKMVLTKEFIDKGY